MTNPLLAPPTLPFDLPDYAMLSDAQFEEAIEAGMVEQRASLAELAANTDTPSVANVIEAWELSGATLRRALNAFWVARAADTNPERDAIDEALAPKLAAHSDAILLDDVLYARLVALSEAGLELDEQDAFWLSERLREFRRGGIDLAAADKDRLREINAELATLASRYDQALVAGRNAVAVHVSDEAELDGLPDDLRSAARRAAEAAGREGWLLELLNTTGQPTLDHLTRRDVRERVFRASVERGIGGDHDTRDIVVRTVALRAERARLLGFDHHAAYVADDGCARTTEAVRDLLAMVAPGALKLVQREAAALQSRLESLEPGATLEPWDWQFLAARAAAESAVDEAELKPYLEFESVLLNGVFAAATGLYGITFHERPELVGYTAESRVFEVREPDGSPLGAVVLDPFTRPGKQGGAWMTNIVDQAHLTDEQPLVTNTCNFPPPEPSAPSLLTWDEVITLFHEFGHDLHGLLSDVRYPSHSGTETPRDFVEFPSQVNEHWAWDPTLIAQYARHHETGEPMPAALVSALVGSRLVGGGYRTFELVSAMLLDQAWHDAPAGELPTEALQVETFEAEALRRAGVWFPLVPPRYSSTYFSHIFAGGYSAGYYSYLWSEVLDADTVAWFEEHGGLDRQPGERFRRHLLGRGGSIDVMDAYRDFRGGEPDVSHLLRRLGLN